jgi:hypothetical protein
MYDAFAFPNTETEHQSHMDRVGELVISYFPDLQVITSLMPLPDQKKVRTRKRNGDQKKAKKGRL